MKITSEYSMSLRAARDFATGPDVHGSPSTDQMKDVLACVTDLRAALKALLPWVAKAEADGAFANCAAPYGGRRALEQAERALAKTIPA